jgi:Cdc6-like AAA superfamily ATPase
LDEKTGKSGPADFYNRTAPTQKALALLSLASSRKPIIFLGERRSGKTSQIQQLKRHLIANSAAECIPVEVPWQGTIKAEQLSREIQAAISSYLTKLPGLAEQRQALQLTADHSIRGAVESLRTLLALAQGRKLVIFIDEFDTILNYALNLVSMTEWVQVIGLAQSLIENSDLPVQLVLAAGHLSPLQIGTRGSLLVSRAEIIRLEPFCDEDGTGHGGSRTSTWR